MIYDFAAFECNLVLSTLWDTWAMKVEYWKDVTSQLLISSVYGCSAAATYLLATIVAAINYLHPQCLSSVVNYSPKAHGYRGNRRSNLEDMSILIGRAYSNAEYALKGSQTQINMTMFWGGIISMLVVEAKILVLLFQETGWNLQADLNWQFYLWVNEMKNNKEDKRRNMVERSCFAATNHVNEGHDVCSNSGSTAAKNIGVTQMSPGLHFATIENYAFSKIWWVSRVPLAYFYLWNLKDFYVMGQISNWDHDLQPNASIQFLEEEIARLKHEFEGKEAAVNLLVFVKVQPDSTEIEVFLSLVVGTNSAVIEVFPSLVVEHCREGTLTKNLKDLIIYMLCKISSLHDFLILGGSPMLPLVKIENSSMHLDISPCIHVARDSDVLSVRDRLEDGKIGQTWEAIEWVMVIATREIREYSYDTIFFLVHSILSPLFGRKFVQSHLSLDPKASFWFAYSTTFTIFAPEKLQLLCT